MNDFDYNFSSSLEEKGDFMTLSLVRNLGYGIAGSSTMTGAAIGAQEGLKAARDSGSLTLKTIHVAMGAFYGGLYSPAFLGFRANEWYNARKEQNPYKISL